MSCNSCHPEGFGDLGSQRDLERRSTVSKLGSHLSWTAGLLLRTGAWHSCVVLACRHIGLKTFLVSAFRSADASARAAVFAASDPKRCQAHGETSRSVTPHWIAETCSLGLRVGSRELQTQNLRDGLDNEPKSALQVECKEVEGCCL